MELNVSIAPIWAKMKQYPKKYAVSLFVALLIVLYAILFFTPNATTLSYGGSTCSRQLMLFPYAYKVETRNAKYQVEPTGLLKLGDVTVLSKAVCFTPLEPPTEGKEYISLSPLGGLLFKKTFAITVESPPKADVAVLDKPIPISRSLQIPLSGEDQIFQYQIEVDKKLSQCEPRGKGIACDIKKLDLLQGKSYQVELNRYFKKKKVDTIIKKSITTLSATRVIETSIKSDETVYIKPKSIEIILDKPITKAKATLNKLEGESKSLVKSAVNKKDSKVTLTFEADLDRSMVYELSVEDVEATDGSGLENPYHLQFKTSGGPKVTGVNIGKTGVPLGSTAIVSFDQALSDKQDISNIVSVSGGATLIGKRGSQLLISLANVPKCGDFSIKITNDLQSNFDIGGNSGWTYAGRTVCHTTETIGYSSRGRAINAYFFGSGPAVIYTGAIHGNEVSTRYLMDNWINDLEANARAIPPERTVVIVPVINPDGLASGARVNARNVDVNRNFATSDWRKDVTHVNNQPFPGGGGEAPMSEPETQVIAGLMQRLRPILVLSYHSQGSVVAANQAGNSSALAGTYAQLSGYRNTTGQTSGTFEYSVSGTADDWYAEKLGVPSILIELGSHSYHQFSRNQKAMWAMLR